MSAQDLADMILPRLKDSTDVLRARLSSSGLEVRCELGHYVTRVFALRAWISLFDEGEEGDVEIMIEITNRIDGFSVTIGIYRESGRILDEISPVEYPGEFTQSVSTEVMDEFDALIERGYGLIVSEIAGASGDHSGTQ
ncbi:hypothetical protein OHV08_15145 [Streptomyces canus]|uniref:hypothetical protein n=1 Tax=Streptomyces canus TaxID=58343 RepID=UPI0032498945